MKPSFSILKMTEVGDHTDFAEARQLDGQALDHTTAP